MGGDRITQFAPKCVLQRGDDITFSRKRREIAAMLSIGDQRQLLLNRPQPSSPGHPAGLVSTDSLYIIAFADDLTR